MNHVWSFFYGSFLNLDVLKKYNVVPKAYQVARLNGYDIEIQPLATLVPDDARCVYGIVAQLTHDDLNALYKQDWLGRYDPYPVLVEAASGLLPALVYISATAEKSPPAADYVMRIIDPSRALGIPEWYLQRLEAFIPRQT